MAQQSGYGIEEIYRGVIGDVVNQVREAFLDEGIDIEVLQQMKKSWETKIQASGAVDLEGRQQQQVPAPLPVPKHAKQIATPIVAPVQPPPIPENVAGTSIQAQKQLHQMQQQQQQQHINIIPTIASTQNPVQLLTLPAQMLASGSSIQLPPGIIPGTQYALVDGPNGAQFLFLNPGQMQQLGIDSQTAAAQFLLQQNVPNTNPPFRRPTGEIATKKEPSTHGMPQLDGGSSFHSNEVKSGKKSFPSKQKRIPQLDGGGPGMTDSSSEEEPEDDDPLNRYADLEDEKDHILDDDNEEDPLNSADDQSDDEDLELLFEADNVVVCQFEKVHRARNKWKFILKDGVMQVKGKDYCFHKSTGEAEW